MSIKFIVEYRDKIPLGNPIYVGDEESFDFEPWLECDCSIMIGIGYNSLDVSLNSGVVSHLSGLNSKANWKTGIVEPPKANLGVLKIRSSENLIPGIGVTYADDWVTTYDNKSGWIQIGNYRKTDKNQFVEFAKNTIAAIKNGELETIWIKPKMID